MASSLSSHATDTSREMPPAAVRVTSLSSSFTATFLNIPAAPDLTFSRKGLLTECAGRFDREAC